MKSPYVFSARQTAQAPLTSAAAVWKPESNPFPFPDCTAVSMPRKMLADAEIRFEVMEKAAGGKQRDCQASRRIFSFNHEIALLFFHLCNS